VGKVGLRVWVKGGGVTVKQRAERLEDGHGAHETGEKSGHDPDQKKAPRV